MIEEQGRVVALEPGAVWVETLRKSTCSSCSANAACGQGLMDRLGVGRQRGYVRALSDSPLSVGDTVVIGVREDLLVRSSLLVYLLPLLGLLAAALAADGLGLSEPLVILAGLLGLFFSWLLVRWRASRVAENPALQPVVLRTLLVSVPAAG
ncbi:SoxR reducing system RseC family protein [Ectopseudomonas hydrolytica]|jgi:sigma-E factor negative regulatory protein RseC|uniref:SoxR reducing system RseC family protein n=1 Tax=Ectopseudomonas hydrolytica TaxID=2493633 RepID=A0ABY5A552_9GAMM|nr:MULTISPECIES: SoxR reducing system RseC family protein [Pseudomonas]ARS49830.1 alginate regulatory protein [Pseudomonas mendocina]EJO92997.1 sigma E positive regulator RseC/MucC [Pseudomonas mendocina DLHK]ATH81430.1 transcriptional regulator [Pseudomonas mendocina]MBA4245453.1 transcriptional regulator [Pseudomonas sp.]MBF8163292.1 SoxR reducing system RseC family protein [Pseudomonas mendocina]